MAKDDVEAMCGRCDHPQSKHHNGRGMCMRQGGSGFICNCSRFKKAAPLNEEPPRDDTNSKAYAAISKLPAPTPVATPDEMCRGCGHAKHLGKCSDSSCQCMCMKPVYVSLEYREALAAKGIEIEGFPVPPVATGEAKLPLDAPTPQAGPSAYETTPEKVKEYQDFLQRGGEAQAASEGQDKPIIVNGDYVYGTGKAEGVELPPLEKMMIHPPGRGYGIPETDRYIASLKKDLRAALSRVAELESKLDATEAERDHPETEDFFKGVPLEAMHQRARWPSEQDAGKAPADWFWLVGYLAGKCLASHIAGNREKALHHTISTAAALANWHLAIKGATNMRPGIDIPALPSAPEVGEECEKL